MDKQEVIFRDLGVIDYKSAWDIQENLLRENIEVKSFLGKLDGLAIPGSAPFTHHYLLFCEHTPVYTLGKSGKMANILISEEEMHSRGIQFFKTNRGGDITFHGLQQIVGYPILDLEKYYTDIGKYLRNIEEVIILMLAEYGIEGRRSAGETGVWIGDGKNDSERKICAIGVRCSRWITMHGFALNVNTDLDYFNNIIPCGIKDKSVTSMKKELERNVDPGEVKSYLKQKFEIVFNSKLIT